MARKKSTSKFRQLSIKIFGSLAKRCGKRFSGLKKPLSESGINTMFKTYLSIMFLLTAVTFITAFVVMIILSAIFGLNPLLAISGILIISSFSASLVFSVIYLFPTYRSNKRRKDIETNLPFVINHLSAIISSGVSPYTTFKILSRFKEYGEVSKEAAKIVRNVDVFGLDETTAIREVINKTPSPEFRNLLEGILTNIQTGGSLKKYLNQKAETALFNYRLTREKYNQVLSTYADFYTALLIAAPLLFIAILSILNLIGGQVFGLPIDFTMNLVVFLIIPALNVVFLLFIHLTQPKM